MWKTVLAGTTVLAIAGASLAYAQQGPGAQGGAQRWKPTAADVTAFGDARIAAIHAGLKLSAEQEKNWPAVESALRDLAKQRSEAFAARASANRPTDPLERLSLRAKTMQERGAALEKLGDGRQAALPEPRRRPEAPLDRARAPQWRRPVRPGAVITAGAAITASRPRSDGRKAARSKQPQ